MWEERRDKRDRQYADGIDDDDSEEIVVIEGDVPKEMVRDFLFDFRFLPEKPVERERQVHFPDYSVKIKLTFQQEFSNVLKIFTQVTDPGQSISCQAFISAAPRDVASKAKVFKIQSGTREELCKTYVSFYDIQRLRTDMRIEITVLCQTDYGTQIRQVVEENLGLPLVAKLRLWEERPILPIHGDHEVMEDHDES